MNEQKYKDISTQGSITQVLVSYGIAMIHIGVYNIIWMPWLWNDKVLMSTMSQLKGS